MKDRQASEVQELVVVPDAANSIQNAIKGEIDSQVATARAFPRDIRAFLDDLKTMACSSQAVASSCFYKLKRKDKDGTTKYIEGPSVRFAELATSGFRNMRLQGRTSGDDGSYVYAMGTAMDVERNVGIQIEVRRRVTNKEGRRFNDDMIAVTANAAVSLAIRNAAFRVIPRALWEPIFEEAKKTAVGDIKAFAVRKQGMVEHFTQKIGVSVEQLCEYLEIPNLEAMTFNHLEDAIGLAQGLKDGDIKFDEAFPPKPAAAAPDAPKDATPLAKLTEQLKQEQQPTQQPGPTPPAPPPAENTGGMSLEESNALDLELANEDARQQEAPAPGPDAAADIAGKVKDLAAGKTMPPAKGPRK